MAKLVYSEAEILSEHDYAQTHEVNGQRLHGGFDSTGAYIPPRSRGRTEAITAWTEALQKRGGAPFACDASLLSGPRLPNARQHEYLIRAGIDEILWRLFTTTGKIEARGRALAEIEFPDLGQAVEEDISQMAIGHLNRGLLKAHGFDEGGQDNVGGHDAMWFILRDLVFEPHDDVEPPERIDRPDPPDRLAPEIDAEFEGLLSFLMNLLIIEFRAEIGFKVSQDTLRSTAFDDRRQAADHAAEMVEHIRTDEEIHVDSLRLYLGELCECTFKPAGGGDGPGVSGRVIIERMWEDLTHWAVAEQPPKACQQQWELIAPLLRQARPDPAGADQLIDEFLVLGDVTQTELETAQ